MTQTTLELRPLDFYSAHSVPEALHYLADRGEETAILAGGTDLMVQLQRREISPQAILHIERINELRYIDQETAAPVLGGLVRHRTLAIHNELSSYSAIRRSAGLVGGWQTQSAGTIGGNICNASPAGDTIPALLIHGAQVRLQSKAHGCREMPLSEFLLGRRSTARRPDELLTQIALEPVPQRSADAYYKVGRRAAMEVAVVGLALRLTLNEGLDTVTDARIALCSAGPAVYRATAAESALCGARLAAEVLKEAGQLLAASAQPIDDVRGTRSYRLKLLPRLLTTVVNQCVEQIRAKSV